jgi:hypothetical protein
MRQKEIPSGRDILREVFGVWERVHDREFYAKEKRLNK